MTDLPRFADIRNGGNLPKPKWYDRADIMGPVLVIFTAFGAAVMIYCTQV